MVIWRLFPLSVMLLCTGGLDAKISLDPIDELCRTRLHHLARFSGGYAPMKKLLCDDYDPNQADILGNTPLSEACDAGQLLNVICLVEHGAAYADLDLSQVKNKRIKEFLTIIRATIANTDLPFEQVLVIATKKVLVLRLEKPLVDEDGEEGHAQMIFEARPATPNVTPVMLLMQASHL